jgi:hypothetical protein
VKQCSDGATAVSSCSRRSTFFGSICGCLQHLRLFAAFAAVGLGVQPGLCHGHCARFILLIRQLTLDMPSACNQLPYPQDGKARADNALPYPHRKPQRLRKSS